MPITSVALDLSPRTVVHLTTRLAAEPLDVDSSFWAHAGVQPQLGEGRILSVFEYTATWTWWERHPVGDEFLFVVEGNVELLLENADGSLSVPLGPGEAAIVPEGAWHRAVVLAPCRLLFVTPTPARTQHRDVESDPQPPSSSASSSQRASAAASCSSAAASAVESAASLT